MTQPPTGTLIGVGVGPATPNCSPSKRSRPSNRRRDRLPRPTRWSIRRENHRHQLPQRQPRAGAVGIPRHHRHCRPPRWLRRRHGGLLPGATTRLAAHLAVGKPWPSSPWATPMLYSSYQHLHRVLAEQFPSTIHPRHSLHHRGRDALGQPLCEEEEILTVLPGTLDQVVLTARLRDTDCAVIMKLGRTFPKGETGPHRRRCGRQSLRCGAGQHDRRKLLSRC